MSAENISELITTNTENCSSSISSSSLSRLKSSLINVPSSTLHMYNNQASQNHIPQVDGSTNISQLNLSNNQEECENCGRKYGDKMELDHHNELYQFGCEDCGICFTTKLKFDFHELEKNPKTGYARDIVPQATKLQFAEGLRWHLRCGFNRVRMNQFAFSICLNCLKDYIASY